MDEEILIPIMPSEKGPFCKRLLGKLLLADKLNSPLGYVLLFLLLAAVGAGIAKFGLLAGILILGAVAGISVVYTIIAYPKAGMLLYLTLAYFIMFVVKLGIDFPFGTIMDGLEALLVFSLLIKQKAHPDWKLFKGSVTTVILVWIVYNLVEVANPVAASRLAWVYTVRSVAVVMLMYFVFLYNINSKKMIRRVLKLWLAVAFIGAIYGLKQQYIGFAGFEDKYLHSDPNIEQLLFIGGTWRKFSIFNDPVVFAYTMSVSSLLCIGLMTGPISRKKKLVLFLLMCTYIWSMLYSGTRGAFVLIPAAMLLYSILRYNRKVMVGMGITAAIMAVLIFIPTSNYTLYRFQSAFKPSDDASYLVRKANQKRIQPYILSHPIGGGLGSTGEWGQRFSPGSYLASFPPDSGYVRVAVEMGWVGLLLLCIFMFTVLKTGIDNYYRIRDPELKSYCLAMVLIVFAFHIGNFPQEALVQYPSNVYFYLVLALIGVTMRLDRQQNELTDGAK